MTTQCQQSPARCWERAHTSGFAAFPSRPRLFHPIPSNHPQRGPGENASPGFAGCTPKQVHGINFKTISEGFLLLFIPCPAPSPVGRDASENPYSACTHSAGKEQAVLKVLQKPFLWHSLMKLVWKTRKKKNPSLNVCCDSATFLKSPWNTTQSAVQHAEYPVTGSGSCVSSKYSWFGVASLQFPGNPHVLATGVGGWTR